MATPSTSLATLRPAIAGAMVEFDLANDRQGFIWNKVLPIYEVELKSDSFGKIPLEQLLADVETERAPRSSYSRSNFTFTQDTYATTEHGHEVPVDDNENRTYSQYMDQMTFAAERARDVVLRNAEKRVASLLFNPDTWTGSSLTTAITHEWDDATNADPAEDIEQAVNKVWEQTGLWPDSLIINRRVFRNLRKCSRIMDRIQSGGAGSAAKASDITPEKLAEVFDLAQVIVAGSAKNTANPAATRSVASVWSNEYAMVARLCSTPNIEEPGLGRTFHWGADGSQAFGMVETYREEKVRGEIVRVRHQVHNKVLYTQCAHLLSNVTT